MQRSDSDRQFCGCPCFVTQSYETLEARRCQHSPNPPVSERFSVWRHRANTLHRDARKGLDEPTNGLIGPDHAGKRYSVPCSHRPARPCSRADISLGLKRLACPLSFDSRTTFNEHLGTRCKTRYDGLGPGQWIATHEWALFWLLRIWQATTCQLGSPNCRET